MKTIILDTNFLIDIVRYGVNLETIDDILEEKPILTTTRQVVFELNRMKSNKNAATAARMIEKVNIRIMKSKGSNADESILNAVQKGTIVATNDTELRKRLKSMKIKTIYLRGKKYLAMS